jgi:hypothetical protein
VTARPGSSWEKETEQGYGPRAEHGVSRPQLCGAKICSRYRTKVMQAALLFAYHSTTGVFSVQW